MKLRKFISNIAAHDIFIDLYDLDSSLLYTKRIDFYTDIPKDLIKPLTVEEFLELKVKSFRVYSDRIAIIIDLNQ